MTVPLIEGWDHMSTVALFAAKGWTHTLVTNSGGGGTAPTDSLVTGRIAGQAYRITNATTTSNGDGSARMNKSLPATYTQGIVGFAFNFSSTPSTTSDIFRVRAGSTATIRIQLTTTGKIQILNSGGGTTWTGTTTLTTGSWNYIEVQFVINGASGSVATQINGTADIATSTINFGSTGVDNWEPCLISSGGFAGSATLDYDDHYFVNTSSSPNNTFLGDVAVETGYPDGAGAHTQWTPDSGSNYARVNEHTGTFPDGDTSYVSDRTVGERDSYTFSDLSILNGTVYAIQTVAYARKDNSGTRKIAMVARPVSTDYDGADQTLGTSYAVFSEVRETNPATSAAWTISEINASEFGLKMTV